MLWPAKALNVDSLQISLLTVYPNASAVYTIYGHTAMRLYDPVSGADVVLNWGMFNSHQPNFLYHFIKGETDYYFAAIPLEGFLEEYSWKNATIAEDVLNIPNENKTALIEMINWNLAPENVEYRYNFLFDNCVTRPRDIIEKFCGGVLEYPVLKEPTTFRQLIHSCTDPYPWMTFGIDLLIGAGADSIVGLRSSLFLPLSLKEALNESYTAKNEEKQPVVLQSHIILDSPKVETGSSWSTPARFGWIMFIHSVVLGLWGVWRRKRMNFFFAPWFLIAGLGGCIVAFITLFSEHPATSPNWNLLWLHPLHLLAFIGYWFKKPHGIFGYYHWINAIVLILALAAWKWLPQILNPADIPYILLLATASACWIWLTKKQRA
jgi:hypothetical protein